MNDIHFEVPNKVDFEVYSVQIDKMNWRKLWDKQEIDLYAFRVNYPKIELHTHKKKATQKSFFSTAATAFKNISVEIGDLCSSARERPLENSNESNEIIKILLRVLNIILNLNKNLNLN